MAAAVRTGETGLTEGTAAPALTLRAAITEFLWFTLKQAWACLFGALMLALILGTHLLWPESAPLARYDFLFLAAVTIQAALLVFRLETLEKARVILAFHVVGTVMELFKTHMGSWSYPEASLIRLGGVPLFSGFMYAAVGSFLARVWHIFDFRFSHYPRRRWTFLLCLLIYVNFFTHHFGPDLRLALFAGAGLLWGRTQVYYRPHRMRLRMPLLLGFALVALFIWIAENIGTFAGGWVYPAQADGWRAVPLTKMGSWFLLMLISFVLVTAIRAPQPEPRLDRREPG
jgi:uncharacterized membrane protein YoaT (DUF817 family)